MPSYERDLDLPQGYNFKKDVQKPIGFITSLTIGGIRLLTDQTVTTPFTRPTNTGATTATEAVGTLKVVAVLKKIKWDLGDTDPIEFEGTLSVTSKQTVMGLLYASMLDTSVRISWVVYEYDPLNRKYFSAFASSAVGSADAGNVTRGVPGLLMKDGDNLALTVTPSPATDVQSPENYDFTIKVIPWPLATSLYLASASLRKVTKPG
mgnify:CR=1 FL=1